MPQLQSDKPRKKVLVVGAGCAGMSCAEQLSLHPDRFEVTVIETQGYCGGQAFSIPIDKDKYGADWMNQVSPMDGRSGEERVEQTDESVTKASRSTSIPS